MNGQTNSSGKLAGGKVFIVKAKQCGIDPTYTGTMVQSESNFSSNMTFPCIKCKIHKYTITQIRKYTNTKCLKDPTCAIFLKSMGFKDIKYDIPVCQM